MSLENIVASGGKKIDIKVVRSDEKSDVSTMLNGNQ
jgi:hypothetical protein